MCLPGLQKPIRILNVPNSQDTKGYGRGYSKFACSGSKTIIIRSFSFFDHSCISRAIGERGNLSGSLERFCVFCESLIFLTVNLRTLGSRLLRNAENASKEEIMKFDVWGDNDQSEHTMVIRKDDDYKLI